MNFKNFFRNNTAMWLLLLLYSGIIFFINIHSGGIYSAQEGRAAIVARNMIESGDYSKIVIKGEPENEKPIFTYWLYALSGKVFGVNEFSVRLPSVLAALISIFCAAWLGMRIYGRTTGYISGYVLSTTFGFVNLGRIARIDIVLCAFYIIAMVFLYEGYFRHRRANAWLYLFYLAISLSIAVKGPVTVFLAGLTVLILIIMEWDVRKSLKMLWELKPISGIIIGLAICVPWLIFECSRSNENFFSDFFWVQNIDRFLGVQTTFCEGKRKSFFYYFPKLFAMALPWSLFVIPLLWQYRRAWRSLRHETWFLLIWFFAILGFFSFSFIKRGDYILPLFPALAILIARYVALEIEKNYHISRHWKKIWIALAALTGVAWIGIIFNWFTNLAEMIINDEIPHLAARDGMVFRDYLEIFSGSPWLTLILVAIALAVLFLLGKQLQKGNMSNAFGIFMVVLLMIFCFYYLCLDPISNRKRTTKEFCLRIQPLLPSDAVIGYVGSWVDEAVFFVNRDYERCGMQDVYDSETKSFKFKYIISDSDFYRETMSKIVDIDKLEKLDSTADDHHYPLTLLKVKE
ncbi:MAG: glycosyltransferase family 39 protein [Victivallaceae bacterium]|nr:glycosyltransferase family 39 protein [Victivallaceae bacterium]